ncbi:unnamed protein product [Hermetia illucens]|uniref:Serine aminopeptidase S33 domain-containing protein n=1 Tax=Hermetia illucens TaxID=343691 RepID=A0A7R8YUY1_HERIL|nr:protein ABHD13 [Hermetia illucens]CAD7086282.1 unnamed protein product [Hermetia illucens]
MVKADWKIVKIVTAIATKIWAASLGTLLTCVILYCFYGSLISFSIFLFAGLYILYHAQDNLLYHPDLPSNSRVYIPVPAMHNLPYETVNIRTSDNATLHAFFIKQNDDKSTFVPTIVYFHGNAGNMGHRLQNVWGIYYNLNCNILMVEYRGYGLSTGSPSEKGLCMDGRAAVDYLYTRHDLDHQKIILFGRSLGGAVAIDVAADLEYSGKIMALMVENTFTSIPDMAVELVHPNVKYLPNVFYKNKYYSIDKVDRIRVPVLFITGLADNLVPPRMMQTLHMKCGSTRKRLLEFTGGSHNDTWVIDGYYQGIATFLVECHDVVHPLQTPPKRNHWPEIHEV